MSTLCLTWLCSDLKVLSLNTADSRVSENLGCKIILRPHITFMFVVCCTTHITFMFVVCQRSSYQDALYEALPVGWDMEKRERPKEGLKWIMWGHQPYIFRNALKSLSPKASKFHRPTLGTIPITIRLGNYTKLSMPLSFTCIAFYGTQLLLRMLKL